MTRIYGIHIVEITFIANTFYELSVQIKQLINLRYLRCTKRFAIAAICLHQIFSSHVSDWWYISLLRIALSAGWHKLFF